MKEYTFYMINFNGKEKRFASKKEVDNFIKKFQIMEFEIFQMIGINKSGKFEKM